jgi:hypothetical protein
MPGNISGLSAARTGALSRHSVGKPKSREHKRGTQDSGGREPPPDGD